MCRILIDNSCLGNEKSYTSHFIYFVRPADVGKPKATVAAAFIEKRIPGCKVTPYYGKIQDKDVEYYSQFTLIICGLDSVQARRWINATVVGMYDEENPGETLKVIVDGGTEGIFLVMF